LEAHIDVFGPDVTTSGALFEARLGPSGNVAAHITTVLGGVDRHAELIA
jgi:hypothetical protein